MKFQIPFMQKFILLAITILLFSCEEKPQEKNYYPNDSVLTDHRGMPFDSLAFYFSDSVIRNGKMIATTIDDFHENWYSSALYSAKEPLLFNYYRGYDCYRFLWLRSFHPPVIFTIARNENNFWLVTKKLNKQPDHIQMAFVQLEEDSPDDTITVKKLSKPDRYAFITFQETKKLEEKDWNEFVRLLNNCSFWNTQPYKEVFSLDGSEWVFEAHLKRQYYFVKQTNPQGNYFKAGEFLIKLSGLKEPIY